MSAAKSLKKERPAYFAIEDRQRFPRELHGETARAAAVAKFRELADKLERGELDGARIQWREGLHHVETVEQDQKTVSLFTYELMTPERPHVD